LICSEPGDYNAGWSFHFIGKGIMRSFRICICAGLLLFTVGCGESLQELQARRAELALRVTSLSEEVAVLDMHLHGPGDNLKAIESQVERIRNGRFVGEVLKEKQLELDNAKLKLDAVNKSISAKL
jgi:hypothetical protein